MYHQLKSYLKFLLRSTNAHGVHSPFVYDLVTKCFYDKKKYKAYATFNNYRTALQKDTSLMSITDFGAGSRIFKSDERRVSSIAKNAGISRHRQQLLYRLVNYFQPSNILELGTSLGMGTLALSLGAPTQQITTVEGCPTISKKAQQYFEQFEIQNIQVITAAFESFFKTSALSTFDFVYIDGNHSKKATLQYFNSLLDFATNSTVFIFDDIYWSPEMTEAWHTIYSHPKVTVSIDTFQWGLVFFRKEQPKQHFRIRL